MTECSVKTTNTYKAAWKTLFAFQILLSAGNIHATATGDSCHGDPHPLSVHCGNAPSAAFDTAGRLWVVFEQERHIYVSYSDDAGRAFSRPVTVNRDAESVWTNGENRPKIAFGLDGEVYVSWTKRTEGRFTGDIRFSRSLDDGRNFAPVRTVNDDGLLTSHRFESLFVAPDGTIYLVWLDKRDGEQAKEEGRKYPGAALYYTVSTDNGAVFAKNRKVADSSCECCRISITQTPQGEAAVFWRHIFGEQIRDHAFVVLGREQVSGPLQRATYDNWQIEACPHHGPAMAAAGDGGYHLAWFTGGSERQGIYYGRYDAGTQLLHDTVPMSAKAAAGHPHIAGMEDQLLLVWKQFDGEKTNIHMVVSDDAGKTWRPAQIIADTTGASDYPFLISHGDQAWLSWHTANEGLRIIPVEIKQTVSMQ